MTMPARLSCGGRRDAGEDARDDGVALIVALMAMSLLAAVAVVLVVGTMTETPIAAAFREGVEAFHAADAAAEFVIAEVAAAPERDAILRDDALSTFVEGPPHGVRAIGALEVDFSTATRDVNALATGGSYRLYAYGRFADMAPTEEPRSLLYVLVWIADLSGDMQEPPLDAPLVGVVAEAYGPRGARRSVAVSIAKSDGAGAGTVRILSWHELR